MTCSHCGAPLRLDAGKDFLACDFCGSIFVPNPNAASVRELHESSDKPRARCGNLLMHAAVEGRRILFCDQCGGMLIPMGAFAALIQDLRSRRDVAAATILPFDPKDLDRKTNCPQCGRTMDTHLYGGGGNVVMSDCEHCEMNWLDPGTLERIVRAPDRQYIPSESAPKASPVPKLAHSWWPFARRQH
jgi:Zn-finger nucleic acid-binding protein